MNKFRWVRRKYIGWVYQVAMDEGWLRIGAVTRIGVRTKYWRASLLPRFKVTSVCFDRLTNAKAFVEKSIPASFRFKEKALDMHIMGKLIDYVDKARQVHNMFHSDLGEMANKACELYREVMR